jgi:hypothetical protein
MPTFIMHTKFKTKPLPPLKYQKELENQTMDRIRSQLPQVTWTNVAVIGNYEYLETFCAPDMETALEVAALVRSSANAETEVWTAT